MPLPAQWIPASVWASEDSTRRGFSLDLAAATVLMNFHARSAEIQYAILGSMGINRLPISAALDSNNELRGRLVNKSANLWGLQ